MAVLGHDFVELSRHLKQERLYIGSERDQLISLHTSVASSAERLYHAAWIARQQKSALSRLILGSEDATPAACCQTVNALESAVLSDGYRRLTYHESKIGRFLRMVRDAPKAVAVCLVQAETAPGSNIEMMRHVACAAVSGLYGNVIMPEDENNLLLVLKHLIEIQVARSDDPRRLLRRGSCAFSTVFKLLNEGMFLARLFLTAALHQPVMQLLMEDEWFYDIDPERTLHRFPPNERLNRFGTPGTKEYEETTRQYREQITNKLVSLVGHFISSLQASMFCFPPSLAWIVAQLYHALSKTSNTTATQARAICADLVLASFICPAVCDPEPHGITSDAPISYIARHNLMQVGQILHVLTISSLDEIDPKTKDLYSKFPKGCMSFVLDTLLDTPYSASPPQNTTSHGSGFCRSSALLSCAELLELVNVVHLTISTLPEDSAERKQLEEIISASGLPPQSVIQMLCSNSSHNGQSGSQHTSPNTTPQPTPPGTPSSIRKLAKLAQQGKEKKKLFLSPASDLHHEDGEDGSSPSGSNVSEDLLVISLGICNECPGLLPEQKVLEQEFQGRQKKVKYNSVLPGEDDPVSESDILVHEKRTRFSLSHDQDSIATSDNLEAISEAASSHSVGSDLDNENDNLSDMVSANVSGRGTPNVSGRDTPISQADSQAEVGAEGGEAEEPNVAVAPPNLPVTVQKTNRVDVTEKFGKFDIKQELERDDIKSTVSDTWSTDVIASDSEPPEQNQLERLEEVVEEPPNLLGVHEVLEILETASDAWSTDVLASDTSERQSERLLELDQDDMASVSGRSVGVGSEIGELVELVAEEPLQAAVAGKQSPRDVTLRMAVATGIDTPASMLSPQKIKVVQPKEPSPSGVDDSDEFAVGSSDSGAFQMDRYIHDNSYNTRQPKIPTRVCPVILPTCDRVDSGILQAFDPLGYAQNTLKLDKDEEEDAEFEVEAVLKETASDVYLGGTADSDSISGLGSSLRSSDSVGSLVDVGIPIGRETAVIATSSSVSVDTLTAASSRDFANAAEPFSDEVDLIHTDKRHTSATLVSHTACEHGGARPKTTSSASGFPPRISISHESVHDAKAMPGGKPLVLAPQFSGDGSAAEADGSVKAAVPLSSGGGAASGHSARSVNKPGSVIVTSPASTVTILDGVGYNLSGKDDDDRKFQDKRKPGLFHTFRERLSKGAFPVTGPTAKGSKRKVTKVFERDDVFRSVPTEAEKGLCCEAGDEGSNGRRVSAAAVAGTCNKSDETAVTVTSEDILAKYRKPVTPKSADVIVPVRDSAVVDGLASKDKDKTDDDVPVYDSNNLESCKAFLDAKKKLRLILSYVDLQISATSHTSLLNGSGGSSMCAGASSRSAGGGNGSINGSCSGVADTNCEQKENELVLQLKIQLAEAINLQDRDLIAQLHETIRCLRQFDNHEIKKLLKTMKEEYRSRSAYIAYLARCRQGLLSSLAFIDRLLIRVNRDKTVVNRYLLSVLVRLFLEKHEQHLLKFISEFSRLTVPDEKTDLVEEFLSYLHKQMEIDVIWQVASENQVEEAKLFIERFVMSRIYTQAMFPNGEADVLRDQILHDHMQKLSKVITPFHKDLRIPKVYHYECPWPAAQTQIYMLNVYKTPKDKLQCVFRCSSTIMNLLCMANEHSVPAADDFIPVLIYVLIKSGVTSLLSNVQFVRNFYEKRLTGEEQYWWMQFSSAIEFIKTMDYNE